MRVLYVARAPFISGAERALASMLRHLDRQRIEPHLVLGHDSPLIDTARALRIDVSVIALPKRSAESMLGWKRSVSALKRLVQELRPNILHANDVPSCQAMTVIGAEHRLPRVVHVRWGISAADAGWWARGGADCVLCISSWVRRELGDPTGTPLAEAAMEVLPDAVDWPAEAPLRCGDDAARNGTCDAVPAPHGGALRLGFAGQLIESKGLDLLIEALARVPAPSRPRVLIAGRDTQRGGAYERELRDLAQRRGVAEDIQWLGFLDDVGVLYRQVGAIVCPSRIEPLGLVPLEAARFGRPALASRVGGFPETIVDGVTGWLVPPDAEGWAAALSRIGSLPHTALAAAGAAANRRARDSYAPALYQRTLMAVYENLLDRAANR
jgi:glycosyltransferase involved in cell wall biosynthesis